MQHLPRFALGPPCFSACRVAVQSLRLELNHAFPPANSAGYWVTIEKPDAIWSKLKTWAIQCHSFFGSSKFFVLCTMCTDGLFFCSFQLILTKPLQQLAHCHSPFFFQANHEPWHVIIPSHWLLDFLLEPVIRKFPQWRRLLLPRGPQRPIQWGVTDQHMWVGQ